MTQFCRVLAVECGGSAMFEKVSKQLSGETLDGYKWKGYGEKFHVTGLGDGEMKFLAKNLGQVVKYEVTFVDAEEK